MYVVSLANDTQDAVLNVLSLLGIVILAGSPRHCLGPNHTTLMFPEVALPVQKLEAVVRETLKLLLSNNKLTTPSG